MSAKPWFRSAKYMGKLENNFMFKPKAYIGFILSRKADEVTNTVRNLLIFELIN
jgi:hypothetical protein